MRPTAPATSDGRRLDTAEQPTRREVASAPYRSGQDRTGQGLPTAVLGTMPTTDAHTALCYLTPAPGMMRRGESSPGHYSLEISVQAQLLPPSLGNPLQGLSNLGIRAH